LSALENENQFEEAGRLAEELGDLERAEKNYVEVNEASERGNCYIDFIRVLGKQGAHEKVIQTHRRNKRFEDAAKYAENVERFDDAMTSYQEGGFYMDAVRLAKNSGKVGLIRPLVDKELQKDIRTIAHERGRLSSQRDLEEMTGASIKLAREWGFTDRIVEVYQAAKMQDEALNAALEFGQQKTALEIGRQVIEQWEQDKGNTRIVHQGGERKDIGDILVIAKRIGLEDKANELVEGLEVSGDFTTLSRVYREVGDQRQAQVYENAAQLFI
jgi:tetratricopeptide (TPR) repeat protein